MVEKAGGNIHGINVGFYVQSMSVESKVRDAEYSMV